MRAGRVEDAGAWGATPETLRMLLAAARARQSGRRGVRPGHSAPDGCSASRSGVDLLADDLLTEGAGDGLESERFRGDCLPASACVCLRSSRLCAPVNEHPGNLLQVDAIRRGMKPADARRFLHW